MAVIFKNPTELDVKFITTFGVSAKEGDTPIGFFGTGLKYAIAILLREKQSVEIMIGDDTHLRFYVETEHLRNKDFQFIYMDDGHQKIQLPFTTELGKKWELWQAFRELHCNSKDEGGTTYSSGVTDTSEGVGDNNIVSLYGVGQQSQTDDAVNQTNIHPGAGYTTIIVTGEEIENVFEQRRNFLIDPSEKPIVVAEQVEIYRREFPVSHAFFRGIAVCDLTKHSGGGMPSYRYNITCGVDLTEDRTAKYPSFDIDRKIAIAIMKLHDPALIEDILLADEGTYEHNISYRAEGTPSETFLNVVGRLRLTALTKINASALSVYENHRRQLFSQEDGIQLTPIHQKTLDRAVKFLKENMNCTAIDQYPIVVVEMNEDVLGIARNNMIFLNQRVFRMGTKVVIATLYEEYLHNHRQFEDCSRELQNFLFEQLIDVVEQLTNVPV